MSTVGRVEFVQTFEAQPTEECALVDWILPWLAELLQKVYKKGLLFILTNEFKVVVVHQQTLWGVLKDPPPY